MDWLEYEEKLHSLEPQFNKWLEEKLEQEGIVYYCEAVNKLNELGGDELFPVPYCLKDYRDRAWVK